MIDDPGADLDVRAWRFSYNARGIIEVPNRLRADRTAVIVVHPWGIDDGQGWRTPEPAGVAFQCTPGQESDRPRPRGDGHQSVPEVDAEPSAAWSHYSLPGTEDPIRKKTLSLVSRPARARPNGSRGETSSRPSWSLSVSRPGDSHRR